MEFGDTARVISTGASERDKKAWFLEAHRLDKKLTHVVIGSTASVFFFFK